MTSKELARAVFNMYLINATLALRSVEREVFVKYNVSYPKFLVLNILIKKGEPVYPTFLAQRMHVSNANMTGLINRMKKDALITKKSDKLDKRAYYIDVTVFGRKLYEQILPEFISYVEQITATIPKDELVNVLNIQKGFYEQFIASLEK